MSVLIRNFRQWWQPPRSVQDRPEHRQVTFLELFYDLVFVVLISVLTHTLAHQIDSEHIANFAFLFVIVWWAWLNGTAYHELHGNNDIRTRVFTFMQMFCVAAMAVFAPDALGDTSVGFALSFAVYQVILTFMWWRTGVHDPHHRPLSRPYVFTFLIATLLFFGSVFVEPPLRFNLWGIATVLVVTIPIFSSFIPHDDPAVRAQFEMSRRATPSIVERMGLFTIIVLGEVIVDVVQGVAGHTDLTLEIGIVGALGMLIAIGLWWLYFDLVSHRIPVDGTIPFGIWMYAHLPLTAGIPMIGATVLNVIEHTGTQLPVDVRWLLVGALAMVLISIAILMQILITPDEHRNAYNTGQRATFIAALAILCVGFFAIQSIPLLIAVNAFMLAPVLLGLKVWIREEVAVTE